MSKNQEPEVCLQKLFPLFCFPTGDLTEVEIGKNYARTKFADFCTTFCRLKSMCAEKSSNCENYEARMYQSLETFNEYELRYFE